LLDDSFHPLKKLSFDRFPRHCLHSAGVQRRQPALNFYAPRFLDVRIDFGFEALDQQAGEGGSFLFRKI
jgi:hypothetical protein